MSEGPFRGVTVALVISVATLSFLAFLVLPALFQGDREVSHAADGYSPSAIGHLAFVRLLRETGVPVLVSRHASASRAGEDGVLLLLEPVLGERSPRDALEAAPHTARRTLVVLPKWQADRMDVVPWAREVTPRPLSDAQGILEAAGYTGRVVRSASGVGPSPGAIPFVPVLSRRPAQLVSGSTDEILATAGGGALLIERVEGERHVLLLSDPDVLSNVGLHRGENAAFVLAVIERLREGRGTVVLDETFHGYAHPPSLTREVVTPPLVFALGHLVLTLLLVAWAANARFGAPDAAPPPFEPGTSHLVRTTAELLRAGGHAPDVLPRYLAEALDHVRLALRAPVRLEGAALDAWLDRVGARRGAAERVSGLREAVRQASSRNAPGTRVLHAAVLVDRWRREILDAGERRPQGS